MRNIILPIILSVLLIHCNDRQQTISGTWKLDSIYSFYNGFGMTTTDVAEEPVFRFEPDKKLVMTIGKESRDHQYSMPHNDSLVILTADGAKLARFFILKANNRELILREEKRPLFKQLNQERYDIRFYSRSADQKNM